MHETKTARQKQAAITWRNNGGRGGFQHPTGFGKTYETLMFVIKPTLSADSVRTALILVPSTELVNQWRSEIDNLIPELAQLVEVQTVQLQQQRRIVKEVTLLVLDEVDEFYSDDRANVWNGTWYKHKFLLWLSATPADKQKRHLPFFNLYPPVDTISRKEAEVEGWISKAQEYNVHVPLTEEEAALYDEYSGQLTHFLGKFDGNFGYASLCLGGGKDKDGNLKSAWDFCSAWASIRGYDERYADWVKHGRPKGISEEVYKFGISIYEQWNPYKVIHYAKEVFKWANARKQLLYNASNKIQKVLDIVRTENKYTVVFSQSVEFVKQVTKYLNDNGIKAVEYHSDLEATTLRYNENKEPSLFGDGEIVHTKTKPPKPKYFGSTVLKRLAIEAIHNGEAQVLVVGKALDKGLNVPKFEVAINTSNTSSSNQYEQRVGRLTRRIDTKAAIDDNVTVYNLIAQDTNEERTFRKAQTGRTVQTQTNTLFDDNS